MQEPPLEILHTDNGKIIDMNCQMEPTKESTRKTIDKKKKKPFFFSLLSFLFPSFQKSKNTK